MENQKLPEAIVHVLDQVKAVFSEEPKLYETFRNCYTNTWNTAVRKREDHTSYIVTGDIPAMWLRDSAASLRPYLIPAREDEEIADILVGTVRRQFQYICIDPYANAFNEEPNGNCWEQDETEMNDWLWERKYEVDSLCYPIQFAWLIWKNTGRTDLFDAVFERGVRKILEVFRTEQYHEEKSGYRFIRRNTYYTDTLSRDGKGALVKSGIGMTWSGFRPSDDACTYGYLVPSNMFAVVVLGYLEEIAGQVLKDRALAEEARKLKDEIYEGIENYAITVKEEYGEVYAYEVDGYGQFYLMDDANVPSLLSMDYLGYRGRSRRVAENTRRLILSEANPFYYKGKRGAGIGSPHTRVNYIWHIALCMQGLTAKTRAEKKAMIDLAASTDGGKGLMHEGFDAEDDTRYTRPWFAWANAMFSELVLDYCGVK
ncbi:MAG: glycoside hydrolase family 125 protein [Lachnospiraceae bacterium]|nr:glycoside hydrolase family 125 protein [Lachnospiraceae bacterium]